MSDAWRCAVWPDPRSRSMSRALESRKIGHFQRLPPPLFTMAAGKWPRNLTVCPLRGVDRQSRMGLIYYYYCNNNNNNHFMAVIKLLYVSWHLQLRTGGFSEQSFTAYMPMLMATSTSLAARMPLIPVYVVLLISAMHLLYCVYIFIV